MSELTASPGSLNEVLALADQLQDATVTYRDSNGQQQTVEICFDFAPDASQWSPIAFDLNDDGAIGVTGDSTVQGHEFDENAATVDFDIDGDGTTETIEWFNGDGDGILVNTDEIGANNEIDGRALFGDQGGQYANGYEKLAQTEDDNSDGIIDGAELDNLAIWVDDGDGVLEAGELKTLESQGVQAISTNMTLESDGRMTSLAKFDAEVTGHVTYSLEGPDAAFFQIDATTGELSWVDGFTADFENPQDADGDNEYDVIVRRSGDHCDDETEVVKVKVQDKGELPGSIAGTYFRDQNDNDVQDASDTAVQNATVELLDASGAVVATTTTDSNGDYLFSNIFAGDYSVRFESQELKEFVAQDDPNANGDDTNDSDVDSTGVVSFTLGDGENKTNVDAGTEKVAADTCIEVHEEDPSFSADFNSHECVYTEDVWFAGAPDKDVYSSNGTTGIMFGYHIPGATGGVTPAFFGAKDNVAVLYVEFVPSDFANLDVVDITNINLSSATQYLLDNGGHSIFKSQYSESWIKDYYAGTQERLSIMEVNVDGFTGSLSEGLALADQLQDATVTYIDSNGQQHKPKTITAMVISYFFVRIDNLALW